MGSLYHGAIGLLGEKSCTCNSPPKPSLSISPRSSTAIPSLALDTVPSITILSGDRSPCTQGGREGREGRERGREGGRGGREEYKYATYTVCHCTVYVCKHPLQWTPVSLRLIWEQKWKFTLGSNPSPSVGKWAWHGTTLYVPLNGLMPQKHSTYTSNFAGERQLLCGVSLYKNTQIRRCSCPHWGSDYVHEWRMQ